MNSNEIPLVMPISGSGRNLNKDERSGFNFNRALTFASAGLITGAAVGYLGYTGYKDYTDYKDIQEYLNKQIGKYIQIKDVEMPTAPPPPPSPNPSSGRSSPEYLWGPERLPSISSDSSVTSDSSVDLSHYFFD